MGVPTSVSIGSMVNLPPTARSADCNTSNCNCSSREKPKNHNIFVRGVLGDVCASRRGGVFLLHLALIDCAKDSMPKEKPKNQNIFVCGVLGDVFTSFGRGMHSFCTLRSLRYFCTLRSLRYPAYFMCV